MLTVLQGDCREVLKTLPDESVHCCVTSPPYYGLRDYDGWLNAAAAWIVIVTLMRDYQMGCVATAFAALAAQVMQPSKQPILID